jgi:organic hydroperoxide reductase OsmC/OhrA
VVSAENLRADVEGDIEDVDGVLRITRIRLRYHARIPSGKREEVERALEVYADKCPAYQSVKGCIDVSWDADLTETD